MIEKTREQRRLEDRDEPSLEMPRELGQPKNGDLPRARCSTEDVRRMSDERRRIPMYSGLKPCGHNGVPEQRITSMRPSS